MFHVKQRFWLLWFHVKRLRDENLPFLAALCFFPAQECQCVAGEIVNGDIEAAVRTEIGDVNDSETVFEVFRARQPFQQVIWGIRRTAR